jgi:hypothetical protein
LTIPWRTGLRRDADDPPPGAKVPHGSPPVSIPHRKEGNVVAQVDPEDIGTTDEVTADADADEATAE